MRRYSPGKLIYVNSLASGCLAVVCIAWPFIDVSYTLIVLSAMGESASAVTSPWSGK